MKDATDKATRELAMPRAWDYVTNIESAMLQVGTEARKIEAAYFETVDRMEELKRLGLIYAGTHYKAGKYLYLVYPVQEDGSRERVYIGADPEKIAAALAGIERGVEYDQLEQRVRMLKDRANRCWSQLSYAHQAVQG